MYVPCTKVNQKVTDPNMGKDLFFIRLSSELNCFDNGPPICFPHFMDDRTTPNHTISHAVPTSFPAGHDMFRQDCLRQIYEMFVEHVIKNPLYQLGDELDNCTAGVSKRAKLVGFTMICRYPPVIKFGWGPQPWLVVWNMFIHFLFFHMLGKIINLANIVQRG